MEDSYRFFLCDQYPALLAIVCKRAIKKRRFARRGLCALPARLSMLCCIQDNWVSIFGKRQRDEARAAARFILSWAVHFLFWKIGEK
jgi:hypothetical protein